MSDYKSNYKYFVFVSEEPRFNNNEIVFDKITCLSVKAAWNDVQMNRCSNEDATKHLPISGVLIEIWLKWKKLDSL